MENMRFDVIKILHRNWLFNFFTYQFSFWKVNISYQFHHKRDNVKDKQSILEHIAV